MNLESKFNEITELIKKTFISQKEILTIDEVCLYTGYTKNQIYKMNSEGTIPYCSYKENGKPFYVRKQIENWMTNHKYCYIGITNNKNNLKNKK